MCNNYLSNLGRDQLKFYAEVLQQSGYIGLCHVISTEKTLERGGLQ